MEDSLVQTAKKNMKILKLENRVNIYTADAATWNYDEYDIFFFFEPFHAEVFRTVINRILETLEKHPRTLTIVYVWPRSHGVFMESGRFKVVKKLYCSLKDHETYIYQTV
jgi:16S rRNA G966 N2-methylase RsmD